MYSMLYQLTEGSHCPWHGQSNVGHWPMTVWLTCPSLNHYCQPPAWLRVESHYLNCQSLLWPRGGSLWVNCYTMNRYTLTFIAGVEYVLPFVVHTLTPANNDTNPDNFTVFMSQTWNMTLDLWLVSINEYSFPQYASTVTLPSDRNACTQ